MGDLNLGYIFYRNIEGTDINFGRDIVERAKNLRVDSKKYFDINNSLKISFKTTYPSLVIGLGYAHDSSENDDYKLGFLFDYTTGLPYIPGSSIKGTIRSMFPQNAEDNERISFINGILGKELAYDEIYALEKSIFGKSANDSDSKDNTQTKDVFYDGYFTTGMGGFLSSDNITPHADEITSPIPLRFLKITPDTKVFLQFGLKDNNMITKEERLKLYSEVLQWTGLGAKTNVGYGVIGSIRYSYMGVEDKDTIKELFDTIKANRITEEEEALIDGLSEYEQIAKRENNSTKNMISILKNNKCSKEARKPLAELIKKLLMQYASTWKNAKKRALDNKEYIETILEG